jgi:putative FmdB family regulatory protein
MPIYEYRCDGCGARVEVLVRGAEREHVCPQCGALLIKRLLSVAHVSKGLTSRQPGRTCCDRAERCEVPPCSTGLTCRHDS